MTSSWRDSRRDVDDLRGPQQLGTDAQSDAIALGDELNHDPTRGSIVKIRDSENVAVIESVENLVQLGVLRAIDVQDLEIADVGDAAKAADLERVLIDLLALNRFIQASPERIAAHNADDERIIRGRKG